MLKLKLFKYFLKYNTNRSKNEFWVQKYIRAWSPDAFLQVYLPEGIKFLTNPSDHGGAYYYYLGGYERRISEIVRSRLLPGGVAVDIGSYYGFYSVLFSKIVGSKGTVHAFEVDEKNYEITERNLALNDCRNVTLNKVAIGELDGKGNFVSPQKYENVKNFDSLNNNSGIGHLLLDKKNNTKEVDVTSFDTYASKHGIGKVDLIKIDVEGFELYALKGMKNVLRDSSPLLIVEFGALTCERAGYSLTELYNFLKSFGYKIYNADEQLLKVVELDHLKGEWVYFNALCIKD